MTVKPGAAARLWDAAALALVVGGAAVYMNASSGMQGLLSPQVRAATTKAVYFERWLHFRTMSNIGIGLVVGGLAIGIIGYLRDRRAAAVLALQATDLSDAQSPGFAPDASPNVPQE